MSTTLAFIFLPLTFAFGAIGASVGLNALIKSNRQKHHLKESVPKPTQLTINTDDVLFSGIVSAVVCGMIAIIALTSLQMMLIPGWKRMGDRTRKIRAGLMAFFTVWLLATQIPFTIFFETRSAIVAAYVEGHQLSAAMVQGAEKALGATPVYNKVYFRKSSSIF